MCWITSALCLVLVVSSCLSEENVTVTTTKGVVVGVRVNPNPSTGASYDAFLGIPYGQVPARFQLSVPRDSWSSPLLTQADGPMCPQLLQVYSEDCLYLNVFTPVNAHQSPGKYPVMVYIHGGGFTFGSSSSLQYGPDFLVPKGVVLVTLNYRLGVAGFLTLGIPEAPGNLGLWDSRLALQWVQQEIGGFGGDPSQVTLFGHSAGSIATLLHYLSPVSSGLLTQAIAQSGQPEGHLLTIKEAVRRAKALSDAVGCNSSTLNDTMLLKCLRNVDINVLVAKQKVPISVECSTRGETLRFIPVMDTFFAENPFFPDSVENLMKQAVNRSKPLLTGFASGDGIVKFQDSDDVWKLVEDHLSAFIPGGDDGTLTERAKDVMVKKIKDNYFPATVDENKILDLVRLYTDYLFAYPTIKVSKLFADFTYGYINNYKGVWNPMPSYFSQYHVTGVFHGAELTYLFYTANSSQDLESCSANRPSLSMRDRLATWWTEFAKTGSPDPNGSWEPVCTGHYLLMEESPSLINSSQVEKQHYQFWANLSTDFNSSPNIVGNIVVILVALWTLVSIGL